MFEKYLIAKGRKGWNRSMAKGCVFCNIARNDSETPSKIVWRDDDIMVLLNMFPYAVGHLQVVPVKHCLLFKDLIAHSIFGPMGEAVEKSMVLLSKVYSPDGFNVGLNLGEAAGNSIDHLHFHVVPRYLKKEVHGFMEACADAKICRDDLDDVHNKLSEHVGSIFK